MDWKDYSKEKRANYITLVTGEYYPDILKEACNLYLPILEEFKQLMLRSESSSALFRNINEEESAIRIQLCRVFKRYVAPELPVEMTKHKTKCEEIITNYKKNFRPINIVQEKFNSRPMPDEALCALLWEYKNRGKKGYDLTERFFNIIEYNFKDFIIEGPKRAGKDLQPKSFWKDYPNNNRPVDFVIKSKKDHSVLAIGLARYDGDRGGAQEDDRTGGYKNCADEILNYVHKKNLKTKVIFLNDGPGLLLGSMWDDYAKIEELHPNEVMVITLRMIEERLTEAWLKGE